MDPYDPSADADSGDDDVDFDSAAYTGAAATPHSPKSVSAGAALARLLAGLPQLSVQVAVRDVLLQMEVGPGTQSCKWLATVAAAQYASMRPEAAPGGTAFLPVHMADSRGNALYPADILCERIEQGDTVRLELLGPRLGPATPGFAREQSLWELYAYASSQAHSLVPIVFLFDATELALSAPPGIFGNFNGWATPIPMHFWKGNTYKLQMDFPSGSDLVFKFVVGGASLLTPEVYPIVHDSSGNKLHHIRVAPVPPNDSMDASFVPPIGVSTGGVSVVYPNPQAQLLQAQKALDLSSAVRGRKVLTLREVIDQNRRAQATYMRELSLRRNGPELPVLGSRIVGNYPANPGSNKVAKSTAAGAQRILGHKLERDWAELVRNISDVFPNQDSASSTDTASTASLTGALEPAAAAGAKGKSGASASAPPPPQSYGERLASLRALFARFHPELVALFNYYAQGTPGLTPGGPRWNLVSFLAFLNLVRVPDAKRTTVARCDRIYFKVVGRKNPAYAAAAASSSSSASSGTTPGSVPLRSSLELSRQNHSVGKVLLHSEDVFSPLNGMGRSEFLEALLRVAMLKFPNPATLADWIPEEKEKEAAAAAQAAQAAKGGMTSAAGIAAAAAREEKKKAKQGGPASLPQPPQRLKDPNPALSFELLMKLHILPCAVSAGVVQAAGPASAAPLPSSSAAFNPLDLRARLLLDPTIFALLGSYSEDLHRLFRHYTGGAQSSGLGIGLNPGVVGMPGAAAHVGVIGGSNGTNPTTLPPTLLGSTSSSSSFGAPGSGLLHTLLPGSGAAGSVSYNPNGSLRSSASTPLASSSIHLREVEQLLADYELLDIVYPRARALQLLGIVLEGGEDGAAPTYSDSAAAASFANGTLELVYPEFLELLIRVADTGHQWSNLHQAQSAAVEAGLASGALNPLDSKVPPAFFAAAGLAGHGGFVGGNSGAAGGSGSGGGGGGGAGGEEEEDEMASGGGSPRNGGGSGGSGAHGASRNRPEEAELCERFARLLAWLFPTEAQQRERRAKMAAQANASAAPIGATTTTTAPPTAAAAAAAPAKEEKAPESAKGKAKGKVASAKAAPAKKPAAKK